MSFFVVAPLFNLSMVTEAYLIRRQPGAVSLPELLGDYTLEQIVPVKQVLLSLAEEELKESLRPYGGPRKVIPLLPAGCGEETIQNLVERGYSLAVDTGDVPVPSGVVYYLLDRRRTGTGEGAEMVKKLRLHAQSGVRVIAGGLEGWDAVEIARQENLHLLEGPFYYRPEWMEEDSGKMESAVTPMQTNLIRLINTVRDDSCDFAALSKLVRQDPALTVSLMRLVNSPYIGVRNRVKSIPQAVTLLGQTEVRKWVATAVFKFMGADRPDELTRGSLIRAKFAENLAVAFSMAGVSDSLFLVGLFSALDGILRVTLEQALEMVPVDEPLQDALRKGEGPFAPVLKLVLAHEQADWGGVLDICSAHNLDGDQVQKAYVEALAWSKDVLR